MRAPRIIKAATTAFGAAAALLLASSPADAAPVKAPALVAPEMSLPFVAPLLGVAKFDHLEYDEKLKKLVAVMMYADGRTTKAPEALLKAQMISLVKDSETYHREAQGGKRAFAESQLKENGKALNALEGAQVTLTAKINFGCYSPKR